MVADFCDSKHASSHALWGRDTHALQIFLYFDELELCNPLGASRKMHKVGMCLHLSDFLYTGCTLCNCAIIGMHALVPDTVTLNVFTMDMKWY